MGMTCIGELKWNRNPHIGDEGPRFPTSGPRPRCARHDFNRGPSSLR
jgi:hypothetical protein